MQIKPYHKVVIFRSFLLLSALCLIVVLGYAYIDHRQSKSATGPKDIKSSEKGAAVTAQAEATKKKNLSSDIRSSLKVTDTKEKRSDPRSENTTAEPQEASDDDTLYIRVQDVLKLRTDPSPDAVRLLVQFLDDGSSVVVSEAIDTLGFLGLQNSDLRDEVLRILQEKARNKDFAQRGDALLTAATIGKEQTLPLVSEYMSEETGEGFAVRALSLINNEACVPLLKSLLEKTESNDIRHNCVDVLARIATPEALNLLMERVSTSNEEDQVASARALSRLNRPEINEALMNLVRHDRLGEEALRSLSSSPAAPQIFSGVLTGYDVDNKRKISLTKEIAQGALYAGKQARSEWVWTLATLLEDSQDPEIQIEAMRTISKIGGGERETPDLLIPKLTSSVPRVREEAVQAFVGYANPWNYKSLWELVFDETEKTRRTAMFAAGRFVNESDVDVLNRAAESGDRFVKEYAKKLLDHLQRDK